MTSTVPSAGDFLEQGDSPPYCWLVQGGARSAQKWIRFRSADALRLERAWGEAETIRRHADVVATAARGRRVAIDMKFSLKENAVPMDSTPSKASKEQQIPVPVFCGRYEVDVENLVMRSVYWEEEERVVVRSLWFHNEEEPEPYGEEDNTALEDGLRNLQSSTSSTLVVPLQAAFGLAEVRFRKNADAGIGEQFTATHESRGSNSSKQAVWRGCRLPPPEDEGEEEALPCNVECLVFVCHGIGTFRSVVPFHKFRTNVEAMRRLMVKYLNRKRQTGETLPGRIEFLPLEWSASVHGRVDPVLKSVTLPTAGSLRHFVNFAVADVVVYETLEWRNEIQSELRQKMERIYTLFKQRNTNFSGEVAVIGHSLGSVIMFDLLHSAVSVPDVSNPREEDEASECARPSGDVNASRKRRSNQTTIHQYSAACCPRRGQSFEESKTPTDAVAQAALANAISSNDHDDEASIERKAAFDSDADSQKLLQPNAMLDVLGALSGEVVCSIAVDPAWTVRRLKGLIASVEGTAIDNQQLLINMQQLSDNEALDAYFKTRSSTLPDDRMQVTLVKRRTESLCFILYEMAKMPGSKNCDDLVAKWRAAPGALREESASDLYQRLFSGARNSAGFIAQARIMKLHEMLSCSPVPPQDLVLAALFEVNQDSAISELICMHNKGTIRLNVQRFKPHARRLRLELRN